MNVGAALVWQLWWPLLPFLILLTARAWCAVCPFAALSSMAQRTRPSAIPVPPPWVRRTGPWLAAISLALVGFLFLLLSLESNGPLTAILLLLFASATLAAGTLWRGRVWCRYLCPLGMMAGLYSRLAFLRLAAPSDPARAASVATKCCPVFTSPVSSRRAQDCVLCGACLKAPGGEAVVARFGAPPLAEELLSPPEGVAASLLLGLMLVDAWRMTPFYLRYMAWAVPQAAGNYGAAQAMAIAGVSGLLLAVQAGVALLAGRGRWSWRRFAHQSAALLPLALATQLALSGQHLMATGEVLQNLGAELGLLAPGHMPPIDAYVTVWPVKGLQWAALAVGAVASLRLAGAGAARRPHLPVAAIALIALALLAIFAQPMSVAC